MSTKNVQRCIPSFFQWMPQMTASLNHQTTQDSRSNELKSGCSDPSFESDPSNEYSLLRLTHVLNSIFLDPSDAFLTQVVNIGIPKQILGFCFQVSKRGYKIGCELTRCMIKIFRGGKGWWMGRGVAVKGA